MKRAIYLSVLVVITVGCILWRVGSDAFGWFYSGDETEQGTEVSLEEHRYWTRFQRSVWSPM